MTEKPTQGQMIYINNNIDLYKAIVGNEIPNTRIEAAKAIMKIKRKVNPRYRFTQNTNSIAFENTRQ